MARIWPLGTLLVMVGPTGVGKTALGIHLAETYGAEIISADSRQIYRELEIGTGKPTSEESKRVKHHLISEVSPQRAVTAAEYAQWAEEIFQRRVSLGKPMFVVGGTGLWIRAFVDGFINTPPPDPEFRLRLQQQAREQGRESLYRELQKIDPKAAERLHPADQIRVIRALEIARQAGNSSEPYATMLAPKSAHWIGLLRSRLELYACAERRIDSWLAAGWLDEVKALLAKGYSPQWPAFQALGYSHLIHYLMGDYSWEQTVAWIKRDTRRYIKRQLTWFKTDLRITWFDISGAEKEIIPSDLQRHLENFLASLHE